LGATITVTAAAMAATAMVVNTLTTPTPREPHDRAALSTITPPSSEVGTRNSSM
jgi:hypothetical protein